MARKKFWNSRLQIKKKENTSSTYGISSTDMFLFTGFLLFYIQYENKIFIDGIILKNEVHLLVQRVRGEITELEYSL